MSQTVPQVATDVQVSVIVPCRNEAGHIREFVASLGRQRLEGLTWEVLVADGMSDDGTRAILDECRRTHAWIRVIDNPGRIVSTGLNAAIAAARGEFVIRMDAHTEYAPDYVRRCVEVIVQTGADNVGGPWQARGVDYVSKAIAAAFNSPLCAGGACSRRCDYEGPVDTVYLGCWRRELFGRLGGFDPELVRNQDDELNFRIVRSGGVVWQSPRIVSWYHSRRTLCGMFRQYLQYGFWKVAVIRKHGRPASWRHLAPATFVLGNVLLVCAAGAGAMAGQTGLWTAALGLWLFQAAAYIGVVFAASASIARREGLRYLPVLPAALAAYQVAYGIGFLLAMLRFPSGSGAGRKLVSAITR